MYILRNVRKYEALTDELIQFAKNKGFGLCFDPMNGLLSAQSVKLHPCDFAFEVTDSFDYNIAELLLSYEGYFINGVQASIPFSQRMQILQDVTSLCVSYSDMLEIYLGDNNPYLPDYITFRLRSTEVAEVLSAQYQKDDTNPFVPCIHLIIEP
jgi:hypothetical protein